MGVGGLAWSWLPLWVDGRGLREERGRQEEEAVSFWYLELTAEFFLPRKNWLQ